MDSEEQSETGSEQTTGASEGECAPGGSHSWQGPPADERTGEQRDRFETCLDLFEKGNFLEVRRCCEALKGQEDLDKEVRARVDGLLARMEIDPVAVWVAVGCFVLIGLVAFFTLG